VRVTRLAHSPCLPGVVTGPKLIALRMPTFETVATRLARCVDLFRDPDAKPAQKAEFRAVMDLLKDAPVTIRVTGGRIEVNGVPCEGGEAGESLTRLVQRLDLHGIVEIAIPQDPLPAELFELFRAVADSPDAADVVSRFGAAGADRVRVVATPSGHVPPRSSPSLSPSLPPVPAASPDDFGSGDPVVPSPDAHVDRSSGRLGTGGILRGESWSDIPSVPMKGVPLVTHDPPPPPAASALPGERAAARPVPSVSQKAPPSPPAPPPQSPPSPPRAPEAVARGTEGAASVTLPPDLDGALAELERSPGAANVGDLLTALTRHAELALQDGRPEQLLQILVVIMRAEQRVAEASPVRRQYGIALKWVYTKRALDALARLVAVPKHRAAAAAALRRGGADAVEVLINLLVAAPTAGERRAVFDALRQMTEGTEQLVHMLGHPQWFVARNVAELIGELGMEDAVPALARQLGHEDERVRKAVALALAKVGTRSAAEPLRRALRDESVEVRMQVALGIGGRKSFALAMPLVVAVEQEENEAVERELILALGRIGSPDAVQALIKFAQPAGRFFGRKPSGLRLAAVEALRLAGTAPAVGTLQGLADDGDRNVRAAARAALTELKRKPRA